MHFVILVVAGLHMQPVRDWAGWADKMVTILRDVGRNIFGTLKPLPGTAQLKWRTIFFFFLFFFLRLGGRKLLNFQGH